MARQRKVHFHSSDDRFCGSRAEARRFTFDPNDVTCRACQRKDTFVLSPSGEAQVAELERKAIHDALHGFDNFALGYRVV